MTPNAPQQWTFWDFVTVTNTPIEDWYSSLSDEAQNLLRALLKNNSKIELPIHWIGWKGFLQGKYKSERIWELFFRADKRQYRVFCIWGDGKKVILLVGCYHKGKVYTPADALDTALKRVKSLKEGRATLRERKIETDI